MLIAYLKFFVLLPVLIYLASIDAKKRKGKLHLYGIKGFFGLPGTGKTMAMCYELRELRKKYGDGIYIMTNFNYNDQDFVFTSWMDLTRVYDKPLIVAWDEIQNEFNSRDFKNFPIALLTQLTQVRKGNGIRLYYTSQRFGFVDKNFRSLSATVCDCKTLLGRYTIVKEYDILDYEELQNAVEIDKKRKVHPKSVITFIQTDKLRDSYDSYAMLETAKFKARKGEYMTREEVKNSTIA
jgi:ATP-dependent Clp protease ATP-binding subunit ClpX